MDKFLRLIAEVFRVPEEDKQEARLEFRLSKKEKELYKAYCKKQGITMSTFMRIAAMNEIDKIITDHYRSL